MNRGETDKEKKFRIKSKGRRVDETRLVSKAFRTIRNTLSKNGVSLTGKKNSRYAKKTSPRLSKPHLQRCAVRMSYAPNKNNGQWAAHGKYITRDRANPGMDKNLAFSATGEVNASAVLKDWQNSNDPRIFKLILSPEFGEDVDLKALTKDYMSKLEKDLGVGLEWIAAEHYNTDHPHVHIVIRGIDQDGQNVVINKDYLKTTMRERAREAVTEQIGFRTEKSQFIAFDKEVNQERFTSLDKMIQSKSINTPDGRFVSSENFSMNKPNDEKLKQLQIRRLKTLETMGLATSAGKNGWILSEELEPTLRKMQSSGDILKTMYSAKDIQSDPRMPIAKSVLSEVGDKISGRVIGTGEDENSGKHFMLLESLDGIVHHLYQTRAMEKARSDGKLKKGDLVVVECKGFEKNGQSGKGVFLSNYGNGHKLLQDKKKLSQLVLSSLRKENPLHESKQLIGWLGQYQQALKSQTQELQKLGVIRPEGNSFVIVKRQVKQPQDKTVKKGLSR